MLVLAEMGVGKDTEVRVGLSVPGPGSLEVGLGCRPCLESVVFSGFRWLCLFRSRSDCGRPRRL